VGILNLTVIINLPWLLGTFIGILGRYRPITGFSAKILSRSLSKWCQGSLLCFYAWEARSPKRQFFRFNAHVAQDSANRSASMKSMVVAAQALQRVVSDILYRAPSFVPLSSSHCGIV